MPVAFGGFGIRYCQALLSQPASAAFHREAGTITVLCT